MALNIDRIRNIVKDAVGWSLMAFVVLAFVLLVVMKVRNVWEPPNDVHSLAIASSKFSILCVCVCCPGHFSEQVCFSGEG